MKTTIDMAREAGWDEHHAEFDTRIDRLVALARADEREQIEHDLGELTGPIYKNARKPHDKMVNAFCTLVFTSMYEIIRKRNSL
jgi:hypothetical protein